MFLQMQLILVCDHIMLYILSVLAEQELEVTELPPVTTKGRHDLHDNYKALLLLAFVHRGLIEVSGYLMCSC